MKIRQVGAELFHVDRRTDRDVTKLTVAFAILRTLLIIWNQIWLCQYVLVKEVGINDKIHKYVSVVNKANLVHNFS